MSEDYLEMTRDLTVRAERLTEALAARLEKGRELKPRERDCIASAAALRASLERLESVVSKFEGSTAA